MLTWLVAVLVVIAASVLWFRRYGSVSIPNPPADPVHPGTHAPSATVPDSGTSPISKSTGPIPQPPKALSGEDMIDTLEGALKAGASDRVIQAIVEVGVLARSDGPQGTTLACILRRIKSSSSPPLVGILTYVLAGYSSLPDELIAEVIAHPSMPSDLVPALVFGRSLGQLPLEWDSEKQAFFWNQVFLNYPDFLPSRIKSYYEQYPVRPGSMVTGITDELIRTVQRGKLTNPSVVSAILDRVLGDEAHGALVLRRVSGMVSLSDECVARLEAPALAAASSSNVRREILSWLSMAPPALAKQELMRVYGTAASPKDRIQAGSALVTLSLATGPESFRMLWSQEGDESVRQALVHAVGSIQTESGLVELQLAYETGSDGVKEAVREEVESHLRVCNCEAAKRLQMQVGTSQHPRWVPPLDEGGKGR